MNILALFAHPDDETMLAGGTLAALAASGHAVHVLLATRGEGGENGEPPICSIEALGLVRQAEAACATEILGSQSLTFLDYVDPRIGPGDQLFAFEADFITLTSQIRNAVESKSIQALITHGSNGEYGHPAHLLVHRAAVAAVQSMPESRPFLYTVQAGYDNHPKPRIMNHDDPAHLVLDISSELETKIQAASCHHTQHASFVRRPSQAAGRLLPLRDVILAEESLHRLMPTYQTGASDLLFDSFPEIMKLTVTG